MQKCLKQPEPRTGGGRESWSWEWSSTAPEDDLITSCCLRKLKYKEAVDDLLPLT